MKVILGIEGESRRTWRTPWRLTPDLSYVAYEAKEGVLYKLKAEIRSWDGWLNIQSLEVEQES